MKRALPVGMVGLGGIAQKMYLPFLSHEQGWKLIDAILHFKACVDKPV
ncbi:hypothetical protein [Laceyella putida]|jgi:predicted dehydrogenase|uniref:Gfo/Idh/MocA-like oxidoreductase N-terminal domain-containing protein n=1 Tax=Laceyella putida TaxID=110101 RepID=A0ABW2RL70_9BACL